MNHNVGKWNGTSWDQKGNLGGWGLLDLAFDKEGQMWCVGTNNNIGKWDESVNMWEISEM